MCDILPRMNKTIELPQEMVEKYIYMYADRPLRMSNGQVNAGCPICHEGKSWGRKRRMYYLPDQNFIYCFNCGESWSTVGWIMAVSGKKFKEIIAEANTYSFVSNGSSVKYFDNSFLNSEDHEEKEEDLPKDTITLNSNLQKLYYSGNHIVDMAIAFLAERRLDKAINIPKYGISLKDKIHKNRIVIPFTDLDGSIPFYQTRKLDNKDYLPKYLSKRNAEKTVFGIDKVDLEFPYLFITEGPLDSCFIKNGVSLAGLKYTDYQSDQLSNFFMHERIWVLDNDFRTNETVMGQYEKLIHDGEHVFIWPKEYSKYKDINEYCIGEQKNSFPTDILTDNAYTGLRALQVLKGIK